MQDATFIEMKVAGIALDPTNNAPIVILSDLDNTVVLPIWIGVMEASAIASVLEGITYSRPMTHDLLKSMIEHLGAKVIKIEVADLKDNVFYAIITVESNGEVFEIDARPSDAIALALRTQAKIYVAEDVLNRASHVESKEKAEGPKIAVGFERDKDKLKEILEKMSPEDFGKFKA